MLKTQRSLKPAQKLVRFLTAVFLLTLTACGGGGGGGGSDNSSSNSSPSSSSTGYQASLEAKGYLCFSDGHCEKFVKTSANFDGSHTTCLVSTQQCTSEPLLNYIYKKVKGAEVSFETNVPTYKGSTLGSCSYLVGNNVGCSYTSPAGDVFVYLANTSVKSTSVTLTYTFTDTSDRFLNTKTSELETNNSLTDYFAQIPDKPISYKGTISEISTIFDNTTAEDWGNDGSSSWAATYKEQRAPICSTVDSFSYSCSYIVKEGEYHECKYWYGLTDSQCSTYSGLPPLTKKAINSQLAFMGFDAASTYGASYSPTYPAAVLDNGCEAVHNYTKDRIISLTFMPNTTDVYEIPTTDTDANKNLVRFNGNEDWANIGELNEHCSLVTGILSGSDGAYVKILADGGDSSSRFTGYVSYIDTKGIKLINASWGNDLTYPTATTDFVNSNHFLVVAGGNGSEDWTQGMNDHPNSKYIWGTSNQDDAVYVGNIQKDYSLHSNSAFPGSNTNIQSRWLVALGTDVITSGTTALTKDGMVKASGSSFSAPFVTRALNLGKSLCTGSTYKALANIMLQTADRSFKGYTASKFGQGMLDVKAFLSSLSASCP